MRSRQATDARLHLQCMILQASFTSLTLQREPVSAHYISGISETIHLPLQQTRHMFTIVQGLTLHASPSAILCQDVFQHGAIQFITEAVTTVRQVFMPYLIPPVSDILFTTTVPVLTIILFINGRAVMATREQEIISSTHLQRRAGSRFR